MIRPIGNRWAIRAAHQALLLSLLAFFFLPLAAAIRFNMLSTYLCGFFFLRRLPFFTMEFVIVEAADKYSYQLQI